MTDTDLKTFLEKLNGYFPNALNETQAEAWVARLRKVELSEAMSALSDYYCSKKLPGDGKTPSFDGFKRHIRQKREERRTASNGPYDDRKHYEAVERGSLREFLYHEMYGERGRACADGAYKRWAFARRALGREVLSIEDLITGSVNT